MSTRPRRKRRSRTAEVATKVTAYSLATGAGICLGGRASAEPVPYTPPVLPVVVENGDVFYIDLDENGTTDLALSHNSGSSTATAYLGGLFDTVASSPGLAELHVSGDLIGTDVSDWSSFVQLSEFVGKRGFLGVSFFGEDEQPHFAYLNISIDETQIATLGGGTGLGALEDSLRIHGGAYESLANTPITAVPEAGGLALLALGTSGLAIRRRARRDVK